MIAMPVFGYKSHISIDRLYGPIHESPISSVAAPDDLQRASYCPSIPPGAAARKSEVPGGGSQPYYNHGCIRPGRSPSPRIRQHRSARLQTT